MKIRSWLVLGLAGSFVAMLAGCSSADDASAAGEDDELRSTERGFEYDCTTPASRTLIDAPSTKVLVTSKHLRFDGNFGQSLGERDATYKSPTGARRARFAGYETGEDCVLKVVADQDLLDGKPTGGVRVQCSGDDFQQDLLECSNPRAARLRLPAAPAPPPPAPVTPPASTRTWKCTTTAEYATLGALSMQVTADAIRIVNADFTYEGTRDRAYRARTGSWMQFEDLEYGGDCSLSAIVAEDALLSTTATTALKIRCAGDGFQEDRYTCKPR